MPETAELELVVEELTETDWDQMIDVLVGANPEAYEGLDIQACGCLSCSCIINSCDAMCSPPGYPSP